MLTFKNARGWPRAIWRTTFTTEFKCSAHGCCSEILRDMRVFCRPHFNAPVALRHKTSKATMFTVRVAEWEKCLAGSCLTESSVTGRNALLETASRKVLLLGEMPCSKLLDGRFCYWVKCLAGSCLTEGSVTG
jgi:hypothetical protein